MKLAAADDQRDRLRRNLNSIHPVPSNMRTPDEGSGVADPTPLDEGLEKVCDEDDEDGDDAGTPGHMLEESASSYPSRLANCGPRFSIDFSRI